ncbi:hypothetical protein DFS34DRAFT_624959 [Phlyctochytrium arcticum]|nr:hypothetical protein DFS34DRAFT_624959 [Phlyctochytrium arcticum]
MPSANDGWGNASTSSSSNNGWGSSTTTASAAVPAPKRASSNDQHRRTSSKEDPSIARVRAIRRAAEESGEGFDMELYAKEKGVRIKRDGELNILVDNTPQPASQTSPAAASGGTYADWAATFAAQKKKKEAAAAAALAASKAQAVPTSSQPVSKPPIVPQETARPAAVSNSAEAPKATAAATNVVKEPMSAAPVPIAAAAVNVKETPKPAVQAPTTPTSNVSNVVAPKPAAATTQVRSPTPLANGRAPVAATAPIAAPVSTPVVKDAAGPKPVAPVPNVKVETSLPSPVANAGAVPKPAAPKADVSAAKAVEPPKPSVSSLKADVGTKLGASATADTKSQAPVTPSSTSDQKDEASTSDQKDEVFKVRRSAAPAFETYEEYVARSQLEAQTEKAQTDKVLRPPHATFADWMTARRLVEDKEASTKSPTTITKQPSGEFSTLARRISDVEKQTQAPTERVEGFDNWAANRMASEAKASEAKAGPAAAPSTSVEVDIDLTQLSDDTPSPVVSGASKSKSIPASQPVDKKVERTILLRPLEKMPQALMDLGTLICHECRFYSTAPLTTQVIPDRAGMSDDSDRLWRKVFDSVPVEYESHLAPSLRELRQVLERKVGKHAPPPADVAMKVMMFDAYVTSLKVQVVSPDMPQASSLTGVVYGINTMGQVTQVPTWTVAMNMNLSGMGVNPALPTPHSSAF